MKKTMVCLAIQLLMAAGAYAGPPAVPPAVTDDSVVATALPPSDPAARQTCCQPPGAGKDASGLPVIDSECIREGEACSILLDRCCPGLSCQGGLAATCLKKK